MGIRAKVLGGKRAKRALARLTTDMHETQEAVTQRWAEQVYAGAVADVPKDTGDLVRALEKRLKAAGAKSDAQVGVWDKDAYYGQFVEWGTSKMAAQPFMYPNASRANRNIRAWVREEFERRVG